MSHRSEHDLDRLVGVLFCDLVDSTQLQSALGAEEADEIRRRLYEALREVLEPFGGEEVKNLGDGLMIVFPVVPTDAVACGAAMQRAVGSLNRRSGPPALSIRIGFSSGHAVYDSQEDDWFGPTVNLAARLCSAGDGGDVFLPASMAADSPGWSFDPVGDLSLKGIPKPVPTVSLRWRQQYRDSPELPPEFDPRHGLKFVGRYEQLRALGEALSTAAGTRLIQLVGQPGAGTTRLLQEWLSLLDPATNVLAGVHRPGESVQELVDRARLWQLEGAGVLDANEGRSAGPLSNVARHDTTLSGTHETPSVVAIDDADELNAGQLLEHFETSSARAGSVVVVTRHTPWLGPSTVIRVGALGGRDIEEILLSAVPNLGDRSGTLARAVRAETDGNAAHVTEACARIIAEYEEATTGTDDLETWARQLVRQTCPYRGLESYGVDDRALFFGRETLIDALVRQVEVAPVVALVGPSGSGKSSVLAAGLAASIDDRSGLTWRLVRVTPGTDPAEAVRRVDAKISVGAPGDGTEQRWLVIIDQFEELFTLTESSEVQESVIEAICGLPERHPGTHVVLGLRADRYQDAVEHPQLKRVLQDHQVLAGPPDADDFRRVIEGPAGVAGLRLESGLVDNLVADLEDQPGSLPLLSHAMYETWRLRNGRTLSLEGYLAAGRVGGAIADTAEREHGAMSESEQDATRSLFLRLVTFDEGGTASRRPSPLADLPADLAAVAERFADARLLVFHSTGVSIAHESLLRAWPRLTGWIESDRESIALRSRLAAAARSWLAAGRVDADLYRGARLESALEWSEGRGGDLGSDESDFLERSRVVAAEQASLQARQARRTRVLLGVVSMLLLAAVVSGIVAVTQRNTAQRQGELAESRQLDAELRSLVAESSNLAATDPSLATLLAVEAFNRSPDDTTEGALLEAMAAQNELIRSWAPPVDTDGCDGFISIAADGSAVYYGQGQRVLAIDPLDGTTSEVGNRPTNCAQWSSDGSSAFAHDGSAAWIAPITESFGEPRDLGGSNRDVIALAVPEEPTGLVSIVLGSPSESEESDGSDAEQLMFISVDSDVIGDDVRVPLPPGAHQIAVTADGATAAVASTAVRTPRQSNASIITVADRSGSAREVAIPDEPTAMAFAPDGEYLVVGDESGRVSAHASDSLEHLGEFQGPGGQPVTALDFDDRGNLLVGARRLVRFFDLEQGFISRNGIGVNAALGFQNRDDGTLVSVGDQGEVELYDPMGGPLASRSAPFDRRRFLEYSSDGRFAVGLDPFDQLADVLDTTTGKRMSLELPLPDSASVVHGVLPISFDEQRGITNELEGVRWSKGDVAEVVSFESDPGFRLLAGDRDETHAAIVGVHPDGRTKAYLVELDGLDVIKSVDLDGPSATALPLYGQGMVLFDQPGTARWQVWGELPSGSAPISGTATSSAEHDGVLAVGTEEGSVTMVNLADGGSEELTRIGSRVMDLTFIRGGSHLLISGDQNTTTLWNLETGREVAVVASNIEERVNSTYGSPSETSAWVNYLDHGVLLDLDRTTLVERACKVAGRSMTDVERNTYLGGQDGDSPCT